MNYRRDCPTDCVNLQTDVWIKMADGKPHCQIKKKIRKEISSKIQLQRLVGCYY